MTAYKINLSLSHSDLQNIKAVKIALLYSLAKSTFYVC